MKIEFHTYFLSWFSKRPFITTAIIIIALIAYPTAKNLYSWFMYANGTLVIGLSGDYKPYNFYDDKNRLVGFDIDIAQELSRSLGKKLVFKKMNQSQLISSLKSGEIDLIMSGLSITNQLLKEIDIVKYQKTLITELALIFWCKIPHNFEQIADFSTRKHRTVGIIEGSWYQNYLEKYPYIESKMRNHSLDLVKALKHKECKAALVETDLANYLKHEYPKIRIFIHPLEKSEWIIGKGIGIKKENKTLSKQITSVITKLCSRDYHSGTTIPELELKWFGHLKHESINVY